MSSQFDSNFDSQAAGDLTIALGREALERIIDAVTARLEVTTAQAGSPWLTTPEAAAYLRCPPSRIKKLTMTGQIPREKDGSRNLYHRDELDRYVRRGGAASP